jgi:uncharacterized membrane protein
MEEYLLISFCVAIVYFVFKMVVNKMKKTDKEENSFILRDSFYVLFITFIVIFVYSNYFKKSSGKTPVFTNEPGF